MLEQSNELAATEIGGAVAEIESEVVGPPKKRRLLGLGVGGWLSVIWLAIVVLGAIFIPMLVHNPADPGLLARQGILKVSGHPLGGDAAGNDMLLLLAKGARSSLIIGIGAVLIGLLIGGTAGLIAGYYRRTTDTVLTGTFNVLLAIPQLILAVALVSALANDSINARTGLPVTVGSTRRIAVVVVALGIVSIPILGRITRANTLQWSQREFVVAARSQGATNKRIMIREVLPNVLPAMFAIALLGIAVAMVAEGGLAILGAGVKLPGVSWGSIIAGGHDNVRDQPHVVFEPLICLFLTVLSLNFLGDLIRARSDVRESAL
jgi:peptide/nickel transport system permease protein